MRNVISLTLFAAVAFAAFFWLTPYLALQRLTDGMENEDTIVVDKYVDFDRVKISMQNDFVADLGLESGKESDSLSAMGNILATRIAGVFINAIVSPETMVSVLKDKDRRERLGLSPELTTLISRGEWINAKQFILKDDYNKPTMLLERTGMKWEVVGISLN